MLSQLTTAMLSSLLLLLEPLSSLNWFYHFSTGSFNTMLFVIQFIDLIAEKFYGVQRRNPLQGIFGDFFKVGVFSVFWFPYILKTF